MEIIGARCDDQGCQRKTAALSGSARDTAECGDTEPPAPRGGRFQVLAGLSRTCWSGMLQIIEQYVAAPGRSAARPVGLLYRREMRRPVPPRLRAWPAFKRLELIEKHLAKRVKERLEEIRRMRCRRQCNADVMQIKAGHGGLGHPPDGSSSRPSSARRNWSAGSRSSPPAVSRSISERRPRRSVIDYYREFLADYFRVPGGRAQSPSNSVISCANVFTGQPGRADRWKSRISPRSLLEIPACTAWMKKYVSSTWSSMRRRISASFSLCR